MSKSKALSASAWVVIGFGISQVIRLGSNLYLTRHLPPESFGVMALALAFMFGVSMLSDIGIQTNIIRSSRGDDKDFLNTAWSLQILRGVVIFLGVIIIALALKFAQYLQLTKIDSAYSNEILALLILGLAFKPLLAGLISINYHTAERNINQKKRVVLELIASFIPVPVMIILVNLYPSVWVLIIGALVNEVVKTGLSYLIFTGIKHKWLLEKKAVAEILDFGKWIILSSLLGFLAMQGDKLLMGALLNERVLGLYAIASLFLLAVEQLIRRLQSSVAFPFIAKEVRGAVVPNKAYYKVRFFMDPAVAFSGCFFMFFGDHLIHILYTDNYSDAGWMLQLFGLQILLLIYGLQGQLFLILGQPYILSRLIVIRVISVFLLFPICFHLFGLREGVLAIALSSLPGALYSFYLLNSRRWINFKYELVVLPIQVLFAAFIMYLCELTYLKYFLS